MDGYTCSNCGQYHEGLPRGYMSEAPALVLLMDEIEQRKRVNISSDQCIVRGKKLFDKKDYFILGNLDIPIIDSNETFSWSVWVSLSKTNFKRASRLWYSNGREQEPPYFGWLSTILPASVYPQTLNLKTNVHTKPVGIRPFVELEPTDHPLALEQRNGITMKRVQEIAELMLHASERSLMEK